MWLAADTGPGPGRRRAAAVWRRLRRRVGFRGATLIWFALIDALYGLSLATQPPPAERSDVVQWATTFIPLQAWTGLFLATSATCIVYAFRRRDRIAFMAASGTHGILGATMLAGWALGVAERGWSSAAIWLGMAGWVTLIAGWPEPTPSDGQAWGEPR